VRPPRQEEIEREPIGTLDVRDGEHLLLQMTSPFGDRVVLGRNGDATWAIRPDGTVDNYPPRRAWPKWVDFGSSTGADGFGGGSAGEPEGRVVRAEEARGGGVAIGEGAEVLPDRRDSQA
jgi:hypothetical protein